MPIRLKLYPIVSRVAAAVLLLAGILKVQQALAVSGPLPWTALALTAFELLFGLWLLAGFYPRWSRLAAVGCFAVYFNVAFYRMLQRLPSCGCFGAVPVQTRAMVDIDALMVLALLAGSPLLESRPPSRSTRVRSTIGMLLVVALVGVLGWQAIRALQPAQASAPARVVLDPLAEVDPAVVARVIQGVERNHAALYSLVCTLEVTRTTPPSAPSPAAAEKDGTGERPKPAPRKQRLIWKSILRGEDGRRDCDTQEADLDAREIRVDARGQRIQYLPGLKQAWLSADEDGAETIDLRCAGFHPPMHSIVDWLRKADVQSAQAHPRPPGQAGEIVRLHVLARGGRDDVTLDCLSTVNYLPIRVVYRFSLGGSIFTIDDLEYQKVDDAPAWVPKTWKYRSFTRDVVKDPDAAAPYDLLTETEVRVVSVNTDVSEETFDPLLPPHTRLVGNLAAQPSTGDTPVRASAVMRADPLVSAPHTPQELSPWLWVLVAIDGAALGICLLFRQELAL